MTQFNFDKLINRRGTNCKKTDLLAQRYGKSDLIPLWIADMDFAVSPEITEALVRRFAENPIYGYTATYDSFWQSIIDWQRRRNNFEFTREEMTCIQGGVTALGMILNYFTLPGDRVVIQFPVYYDFKEVIEGNRRVAVSNDLIRTDDNTYRMDLDGLEQIMKEQRPKLMVVSNPQNPIGIVWDVETLRRLAELARRYNVILFSDEVFSDLMLFGHKHIPLATVSDDARMMTITCGSPGKTFNIAGFKSTWLVINNPDLRKGFYRWVEVNELDTSNITTLLATETAYRYGEPWLEACVAYVEDNVRFAEQYFREHIPAIIPIVPQSTFLMWLDCRGLGLPHDRVKDFFTHSAGIAINDGAIYGEPGYGHVRLNLGSPRSVLEKALEQLKTAVDEHISRGKRNGCHG